MNPTIIIRDLGIHVYPIFIALSLLVGQGVVFLSLLRANLPKDIAICTILLNFLCTILGGTFLSSAMSGFQRFGGVSAIGGAIGMFTAFFIMTRILPRYQSAFLEANVLALPIMYSVSKLACHFSGCCYGMHYQGPFHMRYEGTAKHLPTGNIFPIQLLESIVFLLVFLLALWMIYKSHFTHDITYLLLLYCGIKFVLDYLRDSHAGQLGLSINQWLCLTIGAIVIARFYQQKKRS